MRQVDEIKAGIAEEQPLVAPSAVPLGVLDADYAGNARFLAKLEGAKAKYGMLRRVRGDGNCFYRAYLFGCLEWYARAEEGAERAAFRAAVEGSMRPLLDAGQSEFVLEPFWETIMDEIKHIDEQERRPTGDELAARFAQREVSDYAVAYARLVVGGHMLRNEALFEAFLGGSQTVRQFVAAEVEPMGKDADQVQCVAMANEFGVGVRVEYMDQSEGPINHHDMPDGAAPRVTLLYRPGHYDVLYPA